MICLVVVVVSDHHNEPVDLYSRQRYAYLMLAALIPADSGVFHVLHDLQNFTYLNRPWPILPQVFVWWEDDVVFSHLVQCTTEVDFMKLLA